MSNKPICQDDIDPGPQDLKGNNDAVPPMEKEVEEEHDADAVDQLQQYLGGYGRYQMIVYLLLSLVYMRGGWHVWIPIYQMWAPAFHCSASPGQSLNASVPHTVGDDGVPVYSKCKQYVDLSKSNATEPCHNGWTYLWDSDYTSVVSWLDLVCDDEYQAELTTTMYMVGATCGVVFLAPLGDKFGSKTLLLACLWAQAVVGTALIWAKHIIAFCIIKFLIGMCNMAIALSAYVLMTETFDAAHRELPTIAMQFFWAMGIMTMALLGYLIPRWQDLELTIALPINVLSLVFAFIIPESLPWLLSKGKLKQAEQVITRFTSINRLPQVPNLHAKLDRFSLESTKPINASSGSDLTEEDKPREESQIHTVFTLFKTPRLRIIALTMFYLFLVNSLAYFGVMYRTPQLAGDRFVNLCLLGLVEIPAYFACIAANRLIGRRRSVSIFLLICAVCNIAVIFIPETTGDGRSLHWLTITLVMVGKFGITGSYSTIYLYASEVYPTIIRNQAVGASSFFENIGSIAAPNMIYVEDNLTLGIFGGMTIIGCVLVLLLPETHNRPLPQTIDDIEKKQEATPKLTFSSMIT